MAGLKPKTNPEFDAAVKDLLDNTEKWRLETLEKARRSHPWMSEEQLAHAWAFAVKQLGLE